MRVRKRRREVLSRVVSEFSCDEAAGVDSEAGMDSEAEMGGYGEEEEEKRDRCSVYNGE